MICCVCRKPCKGGHYTYYPDEGAVCMACEKRTGGPMEHTFLSDCCGAEAVRMNMDTNDFYWHCTKCEQVCDVVEQKKDEVTYEEELMDEI